MDFFVIRNQRQNLEICEILMKKRLPYKLAVQEIYPKRSLSSNNYYWGVVLYEISRASGHSQIECHNEYKKKFNFRGDIEYNSKTKQYEWVMEVGSTAKLYGKEFWDYVMQVRADGELEHGIIIQLPNECFIPELDYEFENQYELRRI